MNNSNLFKYILASFCFWAADIALAAQVCANDSEILPSTPTSRFIDGGNVVEDKSTGLIWSKCVIGFTGDMCQFGADLQFTWEGALMYAESSSLAGYQDWRVPNINELRSIVEHQCSDPSINTDVFPGESRYNIVSSTPTISNNSSVYVVFFNQQGFTSSNSRNFIGYRLRLVRDK